jgi:glycerol uptake facilitator-like aquaporin
MIRKVSAEFLGTLLFCYGATTSQGNSYTIAGSYIVGMVCTGMVSAGYISGGCYNPALGFAANFTDAMNYDVSRLYQYWIYLIAPLLGSVLAVPVHREFELEAIAQTEKGSFRQVEIEL